MGRTTPPCKATYSAAWLGPPGSPGPGRGGGARTPQSPTTLAREDTSTGSQNRPLSGVLITPCIYALTPRERDVLRHGLRAPTAEVAERLHLSVKPVRTHMPGTRQSRSCGLK